jgi:methyltransferase (TIGR00027 family)
MKANASRTAELTAMMRAIHQIADDTPKILADPIAPRLVDMGAGSDDWLGPILNHPFANQWRTGFLVRNRYAEDCLSGCAEGGLDQYVILGAGLDTFAFRQPAWAQALRTYEIDHPATQRWKQERLAAAGVAIPANLRFVPIDFERQLLADALRGADFDFGRRTFCSWLGVTQYLTREAIGETLEFVLSLPRSSEIVFSFILPFETMSGLESEAVTAAARICADAGEPWLTTFRVDDLKSDLLAMGFSRVVHLTPEEAHERYLKGRRDCFVGRCGEQLVRAIV